MRRNQRRRLRREGNAIGVKLKRICANKTVTIREMRLLKNQARRGRGPTKNLHFCMSGCSKPWLCRAAKSTTRRLRAGTIERVPSSRGRSEFHMSSLSQYRVWRPPHQRKTVNGRSLHGGHSTAEVAHAAKCELAEQTLRLFGSLRLRVTGFSMIPSVWPGDLLLIRRQAMGQICPGDIVLFARHGRLIAHRVVFKTDDPEIPSLITRGDALPSQDSAISPTELLGKVSGILRAGKWIQPRRRLSFSARIMAMLVSRSGRAAGILSRLRARRRGPCEHEALCHS
jgi:hypothetical protein